jgi:hypothetical protein
MDGAQVVTGTAMSPAITYYDALNVFQFFLRIFSRNN